MNQPIKLAVKKAVISVMIFEAKLVLKRHKPKIVSVTGNVGKTSTKDAVHAVLARAYGDRAVRKSQKSFNSEFGVPLTILGLDTAWSSPSGWLKNAWKGLGVALFSRSYPEWLVLEVGADHPGDIERVSQWLHSDIVVLTRMSDIPVHVEFFKDTAEVLKEKMFLAQAVKKGGTIVVNADDHHFAESVKYIDAAKVFYGKKKSSDVEIVESEIAYDMEPLPLPLGQYAVVRLNKKGAQPKEAKIELSGVIGDHLVYPFAAASAVALSLGLEGAVPDAFKGFETPKGRMRVLPGITSSAIIDDTYNSSPLACAEALNTLAKLSLKGKKVAILGDMKELGDRAEQAHRDIGKLAGETVHTLITVGDLAKYIAYGASDAGLKPDRIVSFATSEDAGRAAKEIVRAGDVVLAKGSQSMRMEKAVKALLAQPEKAGELLVRQEEEWVKR